MVTYTDAQKKEFARKSEEEKKALCAEIEEGVKAVMNGSRYQEWLDVAAKFHTYSINNLMLILLQNPKATQVAGFSTWKKLKRYPKKGAHGIRIFAPTRFLRSVKQPTKDAAGNVQLDANGDPVFNIYKVEATGFKPVSVFDISQTDGDPLPELTQALHGDLDAGFLDAVKKACPFPISYKPLSSAYGYCETNGGNIVIREGLDEKQQVKTLIHEMAHGLLHARHDGKETAVNADRSTAEVQAESVAYTVCKHFGVDVHDYSFGYIAGWSSGKDLKELKASMTEIQKASNDLIGRIETVLQKQNAAAV